MKNHNYAKFAVIFVAIVSISWLLNGAASGLTGMDITASPKQVKWGPVPPELPPGAQLAVISGDPSKAGAIYTIRLKMPDGYQVGPHWHPQDENVTVISGTFGIGMGDQFDKSKGELIKTGGFAGAPKEMHHYAWAVGPTVIQLHGEGPFVITYVNPADDPRTAHH
jgi:hypothetical protein